MSLLDRLLPWRSGRLGSGGEKSVQYEIQTMTYQGGWKNYYSNFYIPDDEPRPTDDDNFWIVWPGRYRYIRRVDGRIDEVIWTYETDDAEEYYEEQREQARLERERERQREELREMTFEEVEAEYFDETNRLDKLELGEIGDRYVELRDAQSPD